MATEVLLCYTLGALVTCRDCWIQFVNIREMNYLIQILSLIVIHGKYEELFLPKKFGLFVLAPLKCLKLCLVWHYGEMKGIGHTVGIYFFFAKDSGVHYLYAGWESKISHFLNHCTSWIPHCESSAHPWLKTYILRKHYCFLNILLIPVVVLL